jgi:hypothetical protein
MIQTRNQCKNRWQALPWRWRRRVPPKRRLPFNGLRGVICLNVIAWPTVAYSLCSVSMGGPRTIRHTDFVFVIAKRCVTGSNRSILISSPLQSSRWCITGTSREVEGLSVFPCSVVVICSVTMHLRLQRVEFWMIMNSELEQSRSNLKKHLHLFGETEEYHQNTNLNQYSSC